MRAGHPRAGRRAVDPGPPGATGRKQEQAAQAHARFADERSDFTAYLALWSYLREQQDVLSGSAFRRMCRREFLSWLRIREWQDLHGQLQSLVRDLGVDTSAGPIPGAAELHSALLSGLLSQIGARVEETREYAGARGGRFGLAPGSPLSRRLPRWVVAAELVETTRLLARTVAQIDPLWIEPVAAHLVVRTHSEPRWSRRRGTAVATERVTLFGLPIVTGRAVDLAASDPEAARELFLRHALVEGDAGDHHAFLRENAAVLAEAEQLERRLRRPGLRPDEWALVDFYAARVPSEITSTRSFDAWWRRARRATPGLLSLPRVTVADDEEFPASWQLGEASVPLTYEFAPRAPDDGVTARLPLPLLAHAGPLEWQVPGRRVALVAGLVRSLPKELRRPLGPAPDVAAAVVAAVGPADGDLLPVVAAALTRQLGSPVRADQLSLDAVPEADRMRFVVVEGDAVLGEGRSLAALRQQLRSRVSASVRAAGGSLARAGLVDWPGGTLPQTVSVTTAGLAVTAYPALVDEGAAVAVRVLATEAEQAREMPAGLNRLLRLTLPPTVKPVERSLTMAQKLALAGRPHRDLGALLEDCREAAVGALLREAGGPVWDEDGWQRLRTQVAAGLVDRVIATVAQVADVLSLAAEIASALDRVRGHDAAVADMRAQLAGLVHPGFVAAAGSHLADLPRYLQAVLRRLDSLDARDAERLRVIQRVAAEQLQLLTSLPPGTSPEAVDELRWSIEELRVSLFAQRLGTPRPVSEARILRQIDALAASG